MDVGTLLIMCQVAIYPFIEPVGLLLLIPAPWRLYPPSPPPVVARAELALIDFSRFSSLVVRERILAYFGSTFEYLSQASILFYFDRAAVQSLSNVIFFFKPVCESISYLIRSMNALNLEFVPDKSALMQYRRIDSQAL